MGGGSRDAKLDGRELRLRSGKTPSLRERPRLVMTPLLLMPHRGARYRSGKLPGCVYLVQPLARC